ncbi:MAG TPA: PDZ domain-containing protein [Verrucomicrobiae bacterium]|nr:PDZ domain-containing protein [Verrucomicrobiae bacterium]
MKKVFTMLSAGPLVLLLVGCGGTKMISQRGWIGGEYVLARPNTGWTRVNNSPGVHGTLPVSLKSTQKSAIQIIGMATNAPAEAAGLRPGDFVLEVNHRRVTSLWSFRRAVDRSAPGARLEVKAYRDGHFLDCQVPVGREKYKKGGALTIVIPTVVHRWDLWPNPGFSLVVAGYEPNPGLRRELTGDKLHEEVYDEDWSVYLGCVELSSGKRVIGQEAVQ